MKTLDPSFRLKKKTKSLHKINESKINRLAKIIQGLIQE